MAKKEVLKMSDERNAIDSGMSQPLTTSVVSDFSEAIQRIKHIDFLPDKVMVKLISQEHSVRISILLLNMIIIGHANNNPFFSPQLNIMREYLDKMITYDESENALIIPFPGVEKIIFSDETGSVTFSKKQIRPS